MLEVKEKMIPDAQPQASHLAPHDDGNVLSNAFGVGNFGSPGRSAGEENPLSAGDAQSHATLFANVVVDGAPSVHALANVVENPSASRMLGTVNLPLPDDAGIVEDGNAVDLRDDFGDAAESPDHDLVFHDAPEDFEPDELAGDAVQNNVEHGDVADIMAFEDAAEEHEDLSEDEEFESSDEYEESTGSTDDDEGLPLEDAFHNILAAGDFIMHHLRGRHPSPPTSADGDAAVDENVNQLNYDAADDAVRHIYLNPNQMMEVTREGNDIILPSSVAVEGIELSTNPAAVKQQPVLLTLPVIQLYNVTVFPLRTIPLWLHEPHQTATFNYCVANNIKQIAILRRSENDFEGELHARYGCTVFLERYESNLVAATQYHPAYTQIKAITKGSQRFRLHSARYTDEQVLLGKIEVLPEFDMLPPDVHMQSRVDRKRFSSRKFDFADNAFDDADRTRRIRRREKERFLCYVTSTSLPVTPQLLCQNSLYALMRKIRQEFAIWHYMSFPDDPRNFAYHAASALPCDDAERENLLAMPSTLHRLQAILKILLDLKYLTCKCDKPLAGREHIFCMTTEGAMGSFVNPSGAVHETITTYRLVAGAHTHIRLLGRPTTENTWFPGYAWTCAMCNDCREHLGWRFTIASAGDEKKLLRSFSTTTNSSETVTRSGGGDTNFQSEDGNTNQVKSFWGFRRASVKPAATVQLYT